MANVDRRWLAPASIAATFVASVIAYTRLPSAVAPQTTELLPFTVPDTNEPGPRWMAAFLIPSIAAVLWLGFRFAATERGQRMGRWLFRSAPAEATTTGQFERFAKTYETVVLGVVALILGVHAGFLAAAFQRPTMAARIIGLTLALFLIAVGNVMPRLRANWVAGLRTKATLTDPDLWRAAHRAFGAALVGAGVLTLVVALAAPRYSLMTGLALLVVSCVVGFLATIRGRGAISRIIAAAVAVLLGSSASGGQTMAARPPAVAVAPSSVTEEAAAFERDGLMLRGTLSFPAARAGRMPVVVIIAGSGPTDRNGNGPLINTNTYAQLAWGLAAGGIASLR